MTKKIVFNSPRRTSSSYMSELIRHSLPGSGNLFFEKMDMESTLVGKIAYWGTTNQNEIQVAVIRNPFDVIVSDSIMGIDNANKEGSLNPEYASLMLNDDLFFIRRVNVITKGLERYYDKISKNSDERHRVYRFEDTTNDEKRFLVVKDILVAAGYDIPLEFESLYELADDQANFGTLYKAGIIVHPDNRTEEYEIIRNRMNSLSDSISLTLVNQKYQDALAVSINL